MYAPLPGLFLKLPVHTYQGLTAHMFPHHDHIGVHLPAYLPQLVYKDFISAVGTVSHYHVLVEPGHVIICLAAIFRRILLGYHSCVYHGEHVRKRHYAPALQHPVQHVYAILRLHTPHHAAMAVFRGDHGLFPVTPLRQLCQLCVYLYKVLEAAAITHIVGIIV